jgi:hypothetical protein
MHDNELGDALTLAIAMLAFELGEETREKYIAALRRTVLHVKATSGRKAAILDQIADWIEDGPDGPPAGWRPELIPGGKS